MAFIDQQQILEATSGGLDIIYRCFPQAKAAQSKADKRFKIRSEERTPSASLKQLPDGIWVVTDFGGDQVSRNGIQVYHERGKPHFPGSTFPVGRHLWHRFYKCRNQQTGF